MSQGCVLMISMKSSKIQERTTGSQRGLDKSVLNQKCRGRSQRQSKQRQSKVARVELRAGADFQEPEKPGWSAGGMAK